MSTRLHMMAAAVLLAGCGGTAQKGDSTRPAGAPARDGAEASVRGTTDMISMERTPCYGKCPVFTIAIAGDGNASFDGKTNVVKTGNATASVPAALAASLLEQADAIGVVSMADKYKEGLPSCGGYVSDLPTVTLTVRRGGSTKTVAADYGCQKIPKALRPLHARLDSIARALGWIPNE